MIGGSGIIGRGREIEMGSKSYLVNLALITLSLLISASCESDSKPNTARTHPLDSNPSAIIVDHLCRDIDAIPQAAIEQAKSTLHIAYGHTSHGSQLVDGMTGLVDFKGALYSWNNGGTGGALDLRDRPSPLEGDLGANAEWAADTRSYLNSHPEVNVIIWSWCGQVSSASEADIIVYLSQMTALESDYPNVKFVYMTGHLDGYGLTGNLHVRNEQIRAYCRANNKILYDFADIESYDPTASISTTRTRTTTATTTATGTTVRRELGDRLADRQSGGMVRLHRGAYAAAERESQGVCRMVALGAARRLGRPELIRRASSTGTPR